MYRVFLYTSNVYFLSDDPYHLAQEGLDGRTDKNLQTIAVTLRLRFAATVNKGRRNEQENRDQYNLLRGVNGLTIKPTLFHVKDIHT